MDFRTEPSNIISKNILNVENIINCPLCNNLLNKEYRNITEKIKTCHACCIGGQCSYCNYSDRPFANGSDKYGGGCYCSELELQCECVFQEKQVLYLICENCKIPKCLYCNINVINTEHIPKNTSYGINSVCLECYIKKENDKIKEEEIRKIKEKEKFNNKWKNSSPIEKLNMYGIVKLKKLAKNKNLKGYSSYSKIELINKLKDIVTDFDFPIK